MAQPSIEERERVECMCGERAFELLSTKRRECVRIGRIPEREVGSQNRVVAKSGASEAVMQVPGLDTRNQLSDQLYFDICWIV